jgi:integrase
VWNFLFFASLIFALFLMIAHSLNYCLKYGVHYNIPIAQIGYIDIETFRSQLPCSNKRKNNVLVPMRSIMKFAFDGEIIEKNPMAKVKNLKIKKRKPVPLSMEEVNLFLNSVEPYYRNFFIIAFYTGMRFGEMAALKWENVDFKSCTINITETRVRGIEGTPKTEGSAREIKMLPPVTKALKQLKSEAKFASPYVFLNKNKKPLLPNSINYHIWKPALKKAGLKARSLYQTRHTFASLMLDGGEIPGWVQKMMGHDSMKMILENYYSHIKNYQRDDGSAFMENVFLPRQEVQQVG